VERGAEEMRIRFLGGCGEVGRSAVLIDDKILLDYGVRPADPPEMPMFSRQIAKSLEAVIVSHAHLDHSGMIPSLMNCSNNGMKLFMTPVTCDIAKILWRDTIKLGEEHGIHLFNGEDVHKVVKNAHFLPFRKRFSVNGYECELFNAGHIPGSAAVHLWKESEDISLLYTGDIKIEETRLLESASPDELPHADILIVESTYFGTEHKNRRELEREFVDSVQETIDRGGHAIVPCFAVGRTQEIVMVLHAHGIIPFVDGLGISVFKMLEHHPSFLKDAEALAAAFKEAKFVSGKKRKKVLSQPSVVVTTAGMLNGGPVLYYLRKLHDDPRSKVLLTGYQIEGTNGRRLLEEKCVETESGPLKVKAEVEQYDFSAHAGDSELKRLVSHFCRRGTEVVFTMHGENAAEFADWIREQGCEAFAPENGQEYIIE